MFQSICFISAESSRRKQYYESLIVQYTIHAADVLTIDDETIGIAQVRSAIIFATNKPYASPYKIIRINGDGLTQEAQQALLKILEEPPATTILVIQVATEKILLPTILSRCLSIAADGGSTMVTAEQQTQGQLYWKKVLQLGIAKRFMETTQLATDREAVLTWLKDQIFFFRNELQLSYKTDRIFTPLECLSVLKALQQTYNYTKMNVSLKILLDDLFLRLPRVSS